MLLIYKVSYYHQNAHPFWPYVISSKIFSKIIWYFPLSPFDLFCLIWKTSSSIHLRENWEHIFWLMPGILLYIETITSLPIGHSVTSIFWLLYCFSISNKLPINKYQSISHKLWKKELVWLKFLCYTRTLTIILSSPQIFVTFEKYHQHSFWPIKFLFISLHSLYILTSHDPFSSPFL